MANRTYTLGEIADGLGIKPHNVKYAIQTLNIQPIETKPNGRIFDQDAYDKIKAYREKLQASHAA